MSPERLSDFVHDQTHDGRAYWTLNIINEFAREALVISRLRLSAVMIQPRMSGMRKSGGISVISLGLIVACDPGEVAWENQTSPPNCPNTWGHLICV